MHNSDLSFDKSEKYQMSDTPANPPQDTPAEEMGELRQQFEDLVTYIVNRHTFTTDTDQAVAIKQIVGIYDQIIVPATESELARQTQAARIDELNRIEKAEDYIETGSNDDHPYVFHAYQYCETRRHELTAEGEPTQRKEIVYVYGSPRIDIPSDDEISFCAGCNTMKHVDDAGYCGRCRAEDVNKIPDDAELAREIAESFGFHRKGRKEVRYYRLAQADEFGDFDETDSVNEVVAFIKADRRRLLERVEAEVIGEAQYLPLTYLNDIDDAYARGTNDANIDIRREQREAIRRLMEERISSNTMERGDAE